MLHFEVFIKPGNIFLVLFRIFSNNHHSNVKHNFHQQMTIKQINILFWFSVQAIVNYKSNVDTEKHLRSLQKCNSTYSHLQFYKSILSAYISTVVRLL